jgi:hypothetical protein
MALRLGLSRDPTSPSSFGGGASLGERRGRREVAANSPLPPAWFTHRTAALTHLFYPAIALNTRPMTKYDRNSTPPTISSQRARRICRSPTSSK